MYFSYLLLIVIGKRNLLNVDLVGKDISLLGATNKKIYEDSEGSIKIFGCVCALATIFFSILLNYYVIFLKVDKVKI